MSFLFINNFILSYKFRHPPISFPACKRSKSDVSVVSLSVDDPACHDGMIRISEKLIKYLPHLPTGVNQKTVLFGDQLYVERGDLFNNVLEL